MTANEFTPTDYLEVIDESQGNKLVAQILLGDAAIPRAGESITLHAEGGTSGDTYEVKRVVYHYGKHWGASDSPCLLKVTVYTEG